MALRALGTPPWFFISYVFRQQMEYRENLKKHDRELRNQEQRVMLDKIQQERDREQAEIAAKKEAQRYVYPYDLCHNQTAIDRG